MVKIFTHTEEIEHCGECCEILDKIDTGLKGFRCGKVARTWLLEDIWGKIPSWCPLPEKATDG